MHKAQRQRIWIVVVTGLLLACVLLLSTMPRSTTGELTGPGASLIRPITDFFAHLQDGVQSFLNVRQENIRLKDENQRLLEDNVQLRIQIKDNQLAAEEYNKLKSAFQLKSLFSNHGFVGSHILERPLKDGFDLYMVNVGREDGLEPLKTGKYAVLDQYANLFGTVYSSDALNSKILPLFHEGFSASGRTLSEPNVSFRVRGSLSLKDRGLVMADHIPLSSNLAIGDMVVTSGRGDGLLPGMAVGKVVDVRPSSRGDYLEAILTPACDYRTTEVVFILLPQVKTDDPTPNQEDERPKEDEHLQENEHPQE